MRDASRTNFITRQPRLSVAFQSIARLIQRKGRRAGLVNRTGRDGRRDNNIRTLRRNDSRADEVDLVSHEDDDGRRRWQLRRRRDCCCCCCCRRRLSSCPSAMTGRRARQRMSPQKVENLFHLSQTFGVHDAVYNRKREKKKDK